MNNSSPVQKTGGLFLFCLAFLLLMPFLNQFFVNLPSKSKLHFRVLIVKITEETVFKPALDMPTAKRKQKLGSQRTQKPAEQH